MDVKIVLKMLANVLDPVDGIMASLEDLDLEELNLDVSEIENINLADSDFGQEHMGEVEDFLAEMQEAEVYGLLTGILSIFVLTGLLSSIALGARANSKSFKNFNHLNEELEETLANQEKMMEHLETIGNGLKENEEFDERQCDDNQENMIAKYQNKPRFQDLKIKVTDDDEYMGKQDCRRIIRKIPKKQKQNYWDWINKNKENIADMDAINPFLITSWSNKKINSKMNSDYCYVNEFSEDVNKIDQNLILKTMSEISDVKFQEFMDWQKMILRRKAATQTLRLDLASAWLNINIEDLGPKTYAHKKLKVN